MPVLSNPRHERFCQYLAQGKTATEAYELAGYKPSRFNASHLADNLKVIERLQQITTKHGVAAAVPAESLIAQAEQVYRAAYGAHQYSAAIGAIREKGVLSGVRIEKSEVGSPGGFDHLSDDELLQAIRERFRALSLTPDAGDDTRH